MPRHHDGTHVRRLAQGLLALLGEHERMLRREAGAGGGAGPEDAVERLAGEIGGRGDDGS